MLSFPSALNKGGNSMVMTGKSSSGKPRIQDTIKSFNSDGMSRIKEVMNINLSNAVKQELKTESRMNIGQYQYFQYFNNLGTTLGGNNDTKNHYYEDPSKIPTAVLGTMNMYRFVYKNANVQLMEGSQDKNDPSKQKYLTALSPTAPSLFNPSYGVNVNGMISNVPLLNDINSDKYEDVSNCTIHELCRLSGSRNSILGNARYKYADFMYCKDLGKVSNNHLITLRRFDKPVGDNIFKLATHRSYRGNGQNIFDTGGERGRLIAWFGTDDNKLEDIFKFTMKSTWKEFTSEVQEIESKSDDQRGGIIGMIANSTSPGYNSMADSRGGGANSIIGKLGSAMEIQQSSFDSTGLRMADDNHRIYTPKNTVQAVHVYEGKLEFAQEFNLVFSYKMRSYANINMKSAFLDLIANIGEVTYNRGTFWGGSRRFIGPPTNNGVWRKANSIIDNTFDKLGGFFRAFASGTINFSDILSSIGSAITSAAQSVASGIKDAAQSVAKKGVGAALQGALQDLTATMINVNEKTGFSKAIKGQLKNVLGRPAIYAMNSLLSGDDTGLWHVTLGNPKNPIMAFGNLIMTNAQVEVTSDGAVLGIDDFPTGLKVTVTLKHARARDLTEVSRMFTKGTKSIYLTHAHNKLKHLYGGVSDTLEKQLDETIAKAQEEQAKLDPQESLSHVKSDAEQKKESDAEQKKEAEKVTNPGLSDKLGFTEIFSDYMLQQEDLFDKIDESMPDDIYLTTQSQLIFANTGTTSHPAARLFLDEISVD